VNIFYVLSTASINFFLFHAVTSWLMLLCAICHVGKFTITVVSFASLLGFHEEVIEQVESSCRRNSKEKNPLPLMKGQLACLPSTTGKLL